MASEGLLAARQPAPQVSSPAPASRRSGYSCPLMVSGARGRCGFQPMSLVAAFSRDPVGPCSRNDPLVRVDSLKTVTAGPSWPARPGILAVPDACAHLKYTL